MGGPGEQGKGDVWRMIGDHTTRPHCDSRPSRERASGARGTPSGTDKVFKEENFRNTRDWIYFCVEFDLQLCQGCHSRARRRPAAPADAERAWFCGSCPAPLHPDLMLALETRRNVQTRCELCKSPVSLRDCWISEDCQRLYCREHLEPLRKRDRFRMTRRFLQVRYRSQPREIPRRLQSLARHADEADCDACAFNGQAIYDGDRLLEIDRGPRRCDSAPDTLNCGGIEN